MSHCSQCGRYVGPYEACPYCGARMAGRVSIRAVKAAAVVLATVGLAVLWLAATRSPVPRIQIGQASATTNMAYVQVQGWVVRGPDYYSDSGYLSFTVADDTGEIRVSAYRKEVSRLRAQGRIPALGDLVSVAGTLRVHEDGVALTVNVPEHVEVLRPEPVERELGSITADDRLLRVRVRGQVWAVRQPYEGLTIITMRDPTGAVDVAVDWDLETLSSELLPLEPGQSVEVVGTVGLYRDAVQIVPVSVMDIVLLPDEVPVAWETNIGALRASDAGRLVAVQGTVTEVTPLPAGVKLTLDDGTGEVAVLLWQDLAQALTDPAALTVGTEMRAVGEVSVYREELEVVPERAMDVEVLTEFGPAEETTAHCVAIGDLTAERVGERVTVEGKVTGVASFSGGLRFTLDDASGQVMLLIWLSTYDELADPAALDLGARVRATGEVEMYEGALQVVPASGADVAVLAPGAVEAPLREIASLATGDAGSLVAVEGAIVRAEPFSSGHRLWLDDGSGEVMLLLWEDIYRRLPGREGLVAGAWVRAVGLVEEYRGRLEIVPRMPHDVRIEEW